MSLTPSDGSAVTGYLRDKSVPVWRKALGLAAILYVAWPFDLIPDVPILGWLDDLGVLSAASLFYLREIRRWAAARSAVRSVPQAPPGPAEPGRPS